MDETERITRPIPERTEPIRSWRALFGTTAERPAGGPAPAALPGGDADDVVARSVDLGYRVIDEYIRQGEKAAQRVRERSYGAETIVGDVQEVASRLARYASDFTALWFELMQSAVAGLPRSMAPPAAGTGGTPPAPAPSPVGPGTAPGGAGVAERHDVGWTRVRVAVCAVRPVEVSLDLRPGAAGRPLVVQTLRSVDPDAPRLTDAVLEPERDDEPMTLRVPVPAEFPPGVYNGLVVDAETSRPLGAVSVRLPE